MENVLIGDLQFPTYVDPILLDSNCPTGLRVVDGKEAFSDKVPGNCPIGIPVDANTCQSQRPQVCPKGTKK